MKQTIREASSIFPDSENPGYNYMVSTAESAIGMQPAPQ